MTAPTGTVKVPVFGSQKKTTVYVVGGAVVIVLGVAAYRARQNKAPATATDPAANGVDPATGYPYGSAEDAQATAANSAYQNPTDYGGGGGPATPTPPLPGITSNAQWTQAATAYLVESAGADAGAVSSALGKYVTGQAVVKGSADDSYIAQAIAAEGYPPQSGSGGFPPSIRHTTAPTPPHTTHPAVTLGRVTVRVASKRRGIARLAWGAVPHAGSYSVHYSATGHAASSHVLATTRSLTMDVHKNGFYDVYAIPATGDHNYTHSPLGNVLHLTGI